MAEKRLTFRIDARDDASAVLGKIGSAAKREMGKAEDALDDTRTAGKRLADALGQMNDEVVRELAGVERAAEKLGTALGPELTAKLGDDKIDRAVQDFRRLGLTFEEIEADAEALAAQIKRADEISERAASTGRRAFGEMGDAARKAGGDVDQTRSVVANFAGNAVQELPGVTAAFGPLGMAAGQFAEYAAEGNISLKNFVAYAGPLAGVALIVNEIANEFQRAAETRAFRQEQISSWSAAIREGKTQLQILADEIDRTGQLLTAFDELGNRGEIDILPDLAELGITVEQFTQLSRLSREELLAWNDAVKESGADVDTAARVYYAAKDAGEQYSRAQQSATVTARVLGDAIEVVNHRLEENRRRNDEARQAALDHVNALDDARRAALNLADAEDATRDAIQDATAATDDSATASDEVAAAWRRAEQAAYDQADAAVVAAQQAYGGALTAHQSAQIQVNALSAVAATLAPGSPLRVNLERYIGELQRVPRTVTTTFNANYAASVNSPASILGGPRAAGGPTYAGSLHPVTEGGSELLHEGGRTYLMAGQDGYVEPLPQAGGAMRGGGGGTTFNVSVTAGFGADGDDIANRLVDALVQWQRRNGQLPWVA